MIHTVYIDDSTQTGKVILRKLQKEKAVVKIKNPVFTNEIEQGYITSSEFRNNVKKGLIEKLTSNGYL